MFAKLSLMSFIYQLVETFYLPNETVKKNLWQIFDRNGIYLPCLNRYREHLLKIYFLSDPKSNICKKTFRDIIFQVIIASKIYHRSDSSHKY